MAFPTADLSSVPQLPDFPAFTVPQSGGMFGGGKVQINPGNAIAGYLAGRFPQYASSFLAPTMAREQMNREAQLTLLRDNLEFQRQTQLAQFQAMLAQQYPTDALSVALRQSGVQPGTPQWQQAQATQAANLQDPVVNAGPYGPVLRSQVAGAASAKPTPTPAAIAALKANPNLAGDFDEQFGQGASASVLGNGGQTPPASGGFLGAPYSPVGPYNRY